MTKLFFDTEFTGLHQKTTLISIGLVSDCGKTFYAELTDYDESPNDSWTCREKNINSLLNKDNSGSSNRYDNCFSVGDNDYVKNDLIEWLSQFEKVELWGDVIAYDSILFNNIFGGAFDVPKNVHYIHYDIATLFKLKGIDTDIDREEFAKIVCTDELNLNKHNALYDAKVTKMCYNKLIKE